MALLQAVDKAVAKAVAKAERTCEAGDNQEVTTECNYRK